MAATLGGFAGVLTGLNSDATQRRIIGSLDRVLTGGTTRLFERVRSRAVNGKLKMEGRQ
jgi:hypothetical protein